MFICVIISLVLRRWNALYDINALFEIAKREVEFLLCDEIFLVKDLYKGYEWNRISRGDRIALGTLFLNFAKTREDIQLLGKNKSGQQSYKKE